MARRLPQPSDVPPACPKCASRKVVRIVFGLPGTDLMEAAERGDVSLGGCCVSSDDPRWQCRACGAAFGRPSEARRR